MGEKSDVLKASAVLGGNQMSPEEFIEKYRNFAVPLTSDFTEMSFKAQRATFVQTLHGGNENKGIICLCRAIQYKDGQEYYTDEKGKRHKKAAFHHDFLFTPEYPFKDRLVFANTNNCYVCANVFKDVPDPQDNKFHRRDLDCVGINAVIMDIDVMHKMKPYDYKKADTLIAVLIGVLKKEFPEPTIITLSGRGFTWIYRYEEPIPVTDVTSIGLHIRMVEKLYERAQELLNVVDVKVDPVVKDRSRVVRHAGTYNVNAGRYALLYEANPESVYSPIGLFTMLNLGIPLFEDEPAQESSEKASKRKGSSKKKDGSDATKNRNDLPADRERVIPDWWRPRAPKAYVMASYYRMGKLEKLPSVRTMVDGSGRHRLLFAYACIARLIMSWSKMYDCAWKLNLTFEEPLDEDDFDDQMNRIGTHMERPEWIIHDHGVYIFHTKTLAIFLNLTAEEKAVIHLCDYIINKERYETHQAQAMKRDMEVAALWLSGMSARAISKELTGRYDHVSPRTICYILDRLGLDKNRDTNWEDIEFGRLQRYTRFEKRGIPASEYSAPADSQESEASASLEAAFAASMPAPDGAGMEFAPLSVCKLSEKNSGGRLREGDADFSNNKHLSPQQQGSDILPQDNHSDTTELQLDSEEARIADSNKPHIIEETPAVILTANQQKALAGLLSDNNHLVLGTAGTGKTVILNEFRRMVGEDCVLAVAPSGKAATGIEGQTIHSAFQLPRGPLSPDYLIMDKQIDVLQNIRYVVIDEIGMVRFDLMQAVIRIVQAACVRFNRIISIKCLGDFGQLPPVMTAEDKEDLCMFWNFDPDMDINPYAFAAPGWKDLGLWNPSQMTFLSESQRSKMDAEYSAVLMRIYQGDWDQGLLDYLNTSYDPNAAFRTDAPHICGRRSEVARINNTCIAAHQNDPSFTIFKAVGSYASGSFPVDPEIPVFIGMPVLICVNSSKYQNGEYGSIIRVNKKSVRIQLDNGDKITVRMKKILSDDGRSFIRQLPIMPAYAMTFHRVQGATLSRAIIHPDCWAPGQLYVGLSRLRSKEGLILAAPITPHAIVCDWMALQAYHYVRTWAA